MSNQLVRWVADAARSMGINNLAGVGSGKSRLLGRIIAMQDFIRGFPVVILDPYGTTIANFLDKLCRFTEGTQAQLWSRVRYVNMRGQSGRVIGWPLIYSYGGESLAHKAGRYLSVVGELDPHLQTAAIMGMNAIERVGRPVGMVLAALGYQITEAENLLRNPLEWEGRFEKALSVTSEVVPAVEYLRWLGEASENQRYQRTEAFLGKIAPFLYDPTMRAMFGASRPGIWWPEVDQQCLAVLVDFSGVTDPPQRAFMMRWVYHSFMEYVKWRGPGRHRPISILIDELTALLASTEELATKAFAADLNHFINVIARNFSIWLTVCSQELYQHSEELQKTLMTMGTQILGVTSDPDAAIKLARQFYRYDPFWKKKEEAVYGGFMGQFWPIDWRSVEFTPEEQELLNSYRFEVDQTGDWSRDHE